MKTRGDFVSFRCGLYDILDRYSSTAVKRPRPNKKRAELSREERCEGAEKSIES